MNTENLVSKSKASKQTKRWDPGILCTNWSVLSNFSFVRMSSILFIYYDTFLWSVLEKITITLNKLCNNHINHSFLGIIAGFHSLCHGLFAFNFYHWFSDISYVPSHLSLTEMLFHQNMNSVLVLDKTTFPLHHTLNFILN